MSLHWSNNLPYLSVENVEDAYLTLKFKSMCTTKFVIPRKKKRQKEKSRSIVGGEMNAPAKNVQRAANESDHRGFPRELHELVERRCRRRRRALPLPRAAAASAAVNSSCRFICTKKRGLERARHYRRACRCPSAAIAPAPSYKVKAASYDNILLRRFTGARKPALPMREAWPFYKSADA